MQNIDTRNELLDAILNLMEFSKRDIKSWERKLMEWINEITLVKSN
jgi:hypothetical protein